MVADFKPFPAKFRSDNFDKFQQIHSIPIEVNQFDLDNTYIHDPTLYKKLQTRSNKNPFFR